MIVSTSDTANTEANITGRPIHEKCALNRTTVADVTTMVNGADIISAASKALSQRFPKPRRPRWKMNLETKAPQTYPANIISIQ